MNTELKLYCPDHHRSLKFDDSRQGFQCLSGCFFPLKAHIPRFVPEENYASSFGLQWNEYRTTQLDSYTGLTISQDRLERLLGAPLDMLKGKQVLEAGCGAGRFTELLLAAGAHVFAVDISDAVEANYKNCGKYSNYYVCQADILKVPVEPEQFDIVICIGVIQHTPNSERTMAALSSHVKPGGLLIIDHYTYGYPVTFTRRMLRSFLISKSQIYALQFCKRLTNILWPYHRFFWQYKNFPLLKKIRSLFLRLSPIVDYHDAYPQLGPELLQVWAALDTHDTLTDHYKHLRSAEEIQRHLQGCGLISIETRYAGNGVEARATKPVVNSILIKNLHSDSDIEEP